MRWNYENSSNENKSLWEGSCATIWLRRKRHWWHLKTYLFQWSVPLSSAPVLRKVTYTLMLGWPQMLLLNNLKLQRVKTVPQIRELWGRVAAFGKEAGEEWASLVSWPIAAFALCFFSLNTTQFNLIKHLLHRDVYMKVLCT